MSIGASEERAPAGGGGAPPALIDFRETCRGAFSRREARSGMATGVESPSPLMKDLSNRCLGA